MYTYWAEYINGFKSLTFIDRKLPTRNRLALTQQETHNYFDDRNLQQMQSIFIIYDEYTTNFILSQLLPPYLNSRTIIHEAYIVSRLDQKNNQESLMYIYDCRLFRSHLYTKEQNDFVSSFLLVYKENVDIKTPIYQIVNPNNLIPCKWLLKVKESTLLRVYSFLSQTMHKVIQKNDKILLPQDQYFYFMEEWLKCHYSYNIDTTVSYFFKGILALLQNQLLLHYTRTLSVAQIYERMFKRPIKTIEKPKNVQQFTLTEGLLQTQTKWQTLKIIAFHLKYRIEQRQDKYECFLIEQQQQRTEQHKLSEEDQLIIAAFASIRPAEQQYQPACY